MKAIIISTLAVIILVVVSWNITAYRDVEYIKENAPNYLESLGYTVLGSDGFTGGYLYGGSVFFQTKRIDTPNLIYSIQVVEWRGELQSYDPQVINTNLILNK